MAEPKNGRIGGGVLQDNLLRDGIDLAFDTDLLYLKVDDVVDVPNELPPSTPNEFDDGDPNYAAPNKGLATRGIGINLVNPNDDLEVLNSVGGSRAGNNIESTYLNVNEFNLQNSEISVLGNSILIDAADNIFATSIETNNIKLDFNTISTKNNANLELRPNGIGTVNIESNLNITGNLHSTGNITFYNNFTLGDNDTDTVFFDSEVDSDIVPAANNTYSLGSSSKQWQNLYSNLLNGQRVEVAEILVGDASLSRRQGNIFYVSTLGDDTNVGDHQHGAFRTLKHALDVVDASSGGPVTIHVYPGEYEEEFPLIVPERVTISGEDLRNTIIKPTLATNTENAFELNQNCVIENITVKDFYSPGYAFSFASNSEILERSPYVRNVTVITQGTVTSASDPRGFDSGDAGRGALIDGAQVLNTASRPSMLFHSVTFITPGVDCVTMTNGVRVEWLNSFTYFANRGLYATQGVGRNAPFFTLEYGAELRSIGSANIYGNFGAVADGADTLMYLIGHNFAYIGAGKNVSNDRTLTLFDQESQELNQGRIYFTSTDADGTFRIGNAFYVNFEDGATSIDTNNIDFTGVSSIIINDGGNITYIDGERIDLGNIRFSGNTVYSLDGDLIFKSATLRTFFDNNPGFQVAKGNTSERKLEESDFRYNTDKNLFEGFGQDITTFAGVYSADQNTYVTANNQEGDLVFVAQNVETARISGNYINQFDSTGNDTGIVQLNGLYNGDVFFDNSLITTTNSNSDLELLPNGASLTQIDDLYVYDNVIENFQNSNFSLFVTDEGYVKFDSTLGIVIPFGDSSTGPVNPEIGDTRWNQTVQYLEVWNGTNWQRAAGEGAEVTEDILKDLVDIYTLVLG